MEQSVLLQVDALKQAGCHSLFVDEGASGAVFDRPGLSRALKRLRSGDTLVVWKLDRLGRSLQGLIGLINRLHKRGIHFASLSECIDTTSPGSRLLFHIMGALAEFKRALIAERTRAGLGGRAAWTAVGKTESAR